MNSLCNKTENDMIDISNESSVEIHTKLKNLDPKERRGHFRLHGNPII